MNLGDERQVAYFSGIDIENEFLIFNGWILIIERIGSEIEKALCGEIGTDERY